MELRFFNPYAESRHTENRLPHWQQENGVYFITFRLADAVPSHLRNQWESERATWLRLHPEPWSVEIELEYHKRFSGAIERWLDAGYGSCLLRRSDCAKIVGETLRHFDGERLALITSVVMPNHVHAVLVQGPEQPLERLIRSWKTFTARQINSLLGRSGSLWQRDYFDRLVRDETHFANCVRYIRRNPEKAHLAEGEYFSTKVNSQKRSNSEERRSPDRRLCKSAAGKQPLLDCSMIFVRDIGHDRQIMNP